MQNSSIEWTDHTFNPWWGCIKVSPGCEHCYAETLANRYGHNVWGPAKTTDRRMMSANYWKQPLKWDKQAATEGIRRRVFCASMADVFEEHPQLEWPRTNLWGLIETTPHLDWLLLTKRPENVLKMLSPLWNGRMPDNVWLGTSVENQEQADKRIPHLLRTPAKVRFLSCEPLLGALDLNKAAWGLGQPQYPIDIQAGMIDPRGDTESWDSGFTPLRAIDWVIAGGESGHGARPIRKEWAQCLQMDCERAGVAFFFKQWGEYVPAWSNDGEPFSLDNGAAFDPGETWPHPRIHVWDSGRVPHTEDLYYCNASLRVGKHAAGRLLNGRTWDQFPQ
jgi:protein gp37